jgi:folate-binding protein YgfZ
VTTTTDIEAEIDCAQSGVIVRPLALGTVLVTGKDRLSWLNGLVTCELVTKKPGDAAYGLVVTKAGKIQSEMYVLVGEDTLTIGLYRDRIDSLVAELDRHLIMEDAEIAVAEQPFVWMLALGPRAEEAAKGATAAGARAGLIARGGLPAAVVAAPEPAERAVLDAVASAAGPSRVASPDGWERVRVENGIPEAGVDFDDSSYPQEASLERDAVSFSKGCYLGQEAVFMLEKRGHVKKRLVQIVVLGQAARGDKITLPEGAETGHVTSAVVQSPGRTIALGIVKYKQARADTELRVGAYKAVVTSLLAIVKTD